jgi:hypothetical protein
MLASDIALAVVLSFVGAVLAVVTVRLGGWQARQRLRRLGRVPAWLARWLSGQQREHRDQPAPPRRG